MSAVVSSGLACVAADVVATAVGACAVTLDSFRASIAPDAPRRRHARKHSAVPAVARTKLHDSTAAMKPESPSVRGGAAAAAVHGVGWPALAVCVVIVATRLVLS